MLEQEKGKAIAIAGKKLTPLKKIIFMSKEKQEKKKKQKKNRNKIC